MLFTPNALHIPDGFLTPFVSLVGWGLALILLLIAVRQTRRQLAERQVPVMGVMAAFIFAAQAVNLPVAAGTSGHLLGGALAAIALGPWAAALVMTAVIVVQGLIFQDGKIVASLPEDRLIDGLMEQVWKIARERYGVTDAPVTEATPAASRTP